ASDGGWGSDERHPRHVAEVIGDGGAAIVGFGAWGVYVASATKRRGFNSPPLGLSSLGPADGGWDSDDRYPRHLADVNGDGRADKVGRASCRNEGATARPQGHYKSPALVLETFGTAADGEDREDC